MFAWLLGVEATWGRALSDPNSSGLFQTAFEIVPFASGRFQIEHQVFHVQPQLAERFLDQREDPAAALAAVENLVVERFDLSAMLGGQATDGLGQRFELGRQLVALRLGDAGRLVHGAALPVAGVDRGVDR